MLLGIEMGYNYREELTFYTYYSREALNVADNDRIKKDLKLIFNIIYLVIQ